MKADGNDKQSYICCLLKIYILNYLVRGGVKEVVVLGGAHHKMPPPPPQTTTFLGFFCLESPDAGK